MYVFDNFIGSIAITKSEFSVAELSGRDEYIQQENSGLVNLCT